MYEGVDRIPIYIHTCHTHPPIYIHTYHTHPRSRGILWPESCFYSLHTQNVIVYYVSGGVFIWGVCLFVGCVFIRGTSVCVSLSLCSEDMNHTHPSSNSIVRVAGCVWYLYMVCVWYLYMVCVWYLYMVSCVYSLGVYSAGWRVYVCVCVYVCVFVCVSIYTTTRGASCFVGRAFICIHLHSSAFICVTSVRVCLCLCLCLRLSLCLCLY